MQAHYFTEGQLSQKDSQQLTLKLLMDSHPQLLEGTNSIDKKPPDRHICEAPLQSEWDKVTVN